MSRTVLRSSFITDLRCPSVDRPLPEMPFAGDRFDLHRLDLVVFQYLQRALDTGLPGFPQPGINIRLALERLTAEAENDVAGLQPGLLRGTFGSRARDDDLALHLLGGDAQPGAGLGRGTAVGYEITEHRL